jgi:membrane-bound lytic murein transglycosylase D
MRASVSFWAALPAALPCRLPSAALGVALCAGLALLVPATALANGKSAAAAVGASQHVRVGPGRGAGERSLDSASHEAEALTEAERPAQSGAVTGEDAELRALAEAERELFPEPRQRPYPELDGELPVSVGQAGPTLDVTGLPLGAAQPAWRKSSDNAAWPRGLALSDLPVSFEQRTLDFIKFYRDSVRGRAIAQAWARKSGRYQALIQRELVRAGLPSDLVWLSLIESGHNITSRSRAGAVGLWQFIPESARLYGLTVDRWVDERLDPVRSTEAAAQYLSDLERRLGSWELAMAAYNMGQGGLIRSIRKYNTNDFWRLSRLEAGLPWETALYVPKILATAIVMRNRRAFGLGDVPADPPLSFDTVYVPSGMPLARIAEDAGVPESAITGLNPQYLTARTPPAPKGETPRMWPVHVPDGRGSNVTRRLAERVTTGNEYATYRVRFGDNITNIAQRLRGTEAELRALNRLDPGERLRAGCTLLVPPAWQESERTAASAPLEDSEDVVVLPPFPFRYEGRERVFYHTRPGDDLATLAGALGVSPRELLLWNGLDQRAHLQADMLLQAFVPNGANLDGVRLVRQAGIGQELEVGSQRFLTHFEAGQGRQRLQILAREGDTLELIGRRYGLSPGMMERINHFARNRRLNEGAAIIVYAKEGATASEVLWSRAAEPLPPVNPPYPASLPGSSRTKH